MKKILLNGTFFLSMLILLGFSSCKKEKESEDDQSAVQIDKKHNTALLLCSFGSTYEQPQVTYDSIVSDFQKKFPNADIYLSFTSRTIISRVYAQIGKAYAQPDLWLDAIGEAGYDTVFVQSLHVIPGEEYLSLMNTDVKKNFMVAYPDVKVAKGACLLESSDDIDAVAEALYAYYKARLDNGEVVAFMGHGNPDDGDYENANEKYSLLETKLQSLSGEKNILVGTVEWGDYLFSHIRTGLIEFANSKNKSYSEITVNLAPLMSIAGDHAQNDLLGDLEDGQSMSDVDAYESDDDAQFSWKLKIEKLGFTISQDGTNTSTASFNVVGLGDHQTIRTVWVNHMVEASLLPESWNDHLGE